MVIGWPLDDKLNAMNEVRHELHQCPALFISAPASGQGKTTATAALARIYRRRGLRVRAFKTGPDFLDPMILERATGQPVYQLDLWMVGKTHCQKLLFDAACDNDLILIEGVMGLFDGDPCSADLAECFGVPVAAIIDSQAMAQTFGAVAFGLAHYRDGLPFAGVFANRVAGTYHASMLKDSLPDNIKALGWLPFDEGIELPDRHLGLVQAQEVADLETRLDEAERQFATINDELSIDPVEFSSVDAKPLQPLLDGVHIAIARDRAFAFIYPGNLDLLRDLGATLSFFSPLCDAPPSTADALYFPGGYPELYLRPLSWNQDMMSFICHHHSDGKPIVAECGGMLYMFDSLADVHGESADMVGLLPGRAMMQTRLTAIALQSVHLPEGVLRGHSFHHSKLETSLSPVVRGVCPNGGSTVEAFYRTGSLAASYVHFYFPSNPTATASLFSPRAKSIGRANQSQ